MGPEMGVLCGNSSQKGTDFFPFNNGWTWVTMGRVRCVSPPAVMPSNRPKLTLNEQAFEDLLAAAHTVQEHNDWLKRVQPTGTQAQVPSEARAEAGASSFCQHCGTLKPSEESRCPGCGQEEFRPGERMQRKWASMWLMSQEKGLWPERPVEAVDAAPVEAAPKNGGGSQTVREVPEEAVSPFEVERLRGKLAANEAAHEHPAAASEWSAESPVGTDLSDEASAEHSDLTAQTFSLSASDDSFPADEATTDETTDTMTGEGAGHPESLRQRLADLSVTLRLHRSDLYLGAAVLLAVLALLWPTVGSPQPAALGPMDRALIALGIAEAPAPVVHLQGDPGIDVWVDPHTALYYCPGEELYGKTTDGRVSTQHEAQMDRFQPAERVPCE